MKMTGSHQRHETPLLQDLHELGLKHGIKMVIVAIPLTPDDPEGVRPILIDHKEHTPIEDLSPAFVGAGVFLIKCASAAETYAGDLAAQAEKEGTP